LHIFAAGSCRGEEGLFAFNTTILGKKNATSKKLGPG